MKSTRRPDLGLLSLLITLVLLTGCASHPRGGHATVDFRDPARFSDLQLPGKSREQTAAIVLPRLQEEVDALAANSIPAGYTVHIIITEIDQAGYIPNPGGANPIRVTGDNSPAILAFDFTVTGASGEVVKSGQRRLMQIGADLAPFLDDDSPVPLLEYMMDNWLGSLGWELSHSRG